MAAVIDLWNQALSECGARAVVTSTTEQSKEAQVCSIHYNNIRTSLLRAAPWASVRFQAQLEVDETYASPFGDTFPWGYSYLYPCDCLMFRYLVQAPVDESGNIRVGPWATPSRANRFIPSLSADGTYKIILSNVKDAVGVYTKDITDVNLFDQGLWDAIVSLLCAKIVIPLTGNVQMKGTFEQLARVAIMEARRRTVTRRSPRPTTHRTG
jgi:hypothetical protein